jgi:FkbM family methyltransferase
VSDFRDSLAGRKKSWFGLKKLVKQAASYKAPNATLRIVSRYVPGLRTGRLPAPRTLREVTGYVDQAQYVMLRPDRCEIAKELYWGHGHRPRPEDANALEIVARLALDADCFIDIGAYTGVFTLATTAVNPSLVAHAFEIVPAVASLLDSNVQRNQIESRVTVHREGIGRPGTTMTIATGEGGSALPSFYSSRMHFKDGVSVTFRSLDSLNELVASAQHIVMKIDVEGTEADIFTNGAVFLERHKPDILCEVLRGQGDAETLNRILAPIGYRFFLVREQDLMQRATIVPSSRFRDWLFTTREEADAHLLRQGQKES